MPYREEENVDDEEEEVEEEEEEEEEIGEDEGSEIPAEETNDYADEIQEVITKYNENPLELSTFSTGGEIEDTMGVPAVHVEGVGRIAYPLCNQQTVDLLRVSSQAPFGKGKETVLDVDVRRAWQIDSGLVKINQKWLDGSLPKLVTQCCAKLGIDAVKMNVRANLYKMLLYEEGGHFKKHRDTEKEPGMFGSLLIQLPAEHEGGHLVVEHDRQIKRYRFDKESADKGYYAAFYADCEHTLEPVTKGLRLVLAFNLVRGTSASGVSLAPASATHRRGFEDVLVAASKAWLEDSNAVQKLVVPLAHQYTHTNVSFAGLKGTDLSTLTLLQGVCDPATNEKVFTVYLALVTKYVSGQDDEDDYGYGDGDKEITYETDTWVGPNGATDLGDLAIDFDEEVITARGEPANESTEDIFGSDPDREEKEGYQGNYPGTAEYWYYSAVLVFWPAQRDFDLKLTANFSQAIALLENTDRALPEYTQKLERLLAYLGTRAATTAWQPASVMPLVQTLPHVQTVMRMCRKLTSMSKADGEAIAAVVMQHGWATLDKDFIALIKGQSPIVVTVLLEKLKPFCSLSLSVSAASSTDAAPVPYAVWTALVQILITKTLQSAPISTSGSSYDRMYPASGAVPIAPKIYVKEVDWFQISLFIQNHHFNANDQVAVAAHISSLLKLQPLNHLIQLLLEAYDGTKEVSSLQTQLRACAVQQCLNKSQTGPDVIATLRWILHTHDEELLAKLLPTLRLLNSKAEHARALFALPEVLTELQTESAASQALEGLMQARITVVAPHAAVPAFTWRMPANQLVCDDARVGAFLASEQQTTYLTGGFGGIVYARKWISRYLGYTRERCVIGEAFGSGQSAGVKLTKTRGVHDAAVKRCAENAAELQRLRKLLRAHGRDTAESSGAGGSSGEPEAKKAKVDPVIYVID